MEGCSTIQKRKKFNIDAFWTYFNSIWYTWIYFILHVWNWWSCHQGETIIEERCRVCCLCGVMVTKRSLLDASGDWWSRCGCTDSSRVRYMRRYRRVRIKVSHYRLNLLFFPLCFYHLFFAADHLDLLFIYYKLFLPLVHSFFFLLSTKGISVIHLNFLLWPNWPTQHLNLVGIRIL